MCDAAFIAEFRHYIFEAIWKVIVAYKFRGFVLGQCNIHHRDHTSLCVLYSSVQV